MSFGRQSPSLNARAKNTGQDLVNLAKTVGSNYFLEDSRILVDFKKGFDTFAARFDHHANSAPLNLNSTSVGDDGVEPSTCRLRRPFLQLWAHLGSNQGPRSYQERALPLSHAPKLYTQYFFKQLSTFTCL